MLAVRRSAKATAARGRPRVSLGRHPGAGPNQGHDCLTCDAAGCSAGQWRAALLAWSMAQPGTRRDGRHCCVQSETRKCSQFLGLSRRRRGALLVRYLQRTRMTRTSMHKSWMIALVGFCGASLWISVGCSSLPRFCTAPDPLRADLPGRIDGAGGRTGQLPVPGVRAAGDRRCWGRGRRERWPLLRLVRQRAADAGAGLPGLRRPGDGGWGRQRRRSLPHGDDPLLVRVVPRRSRSTGMGIAPILPPR